MTRPRAADDAPPRSRGPRLLMVFLLCAGAFAGRAASMLLPSGPLGLFNLAIYVGLALSLALAYRRFARRAVADRRRDRLRRDRARGGDEGRG